MKKLFYVASLCCFIMATQSCSSKKEILNTNLYQGTFYNGNLHCPNTILITKSIENGLPINNSISFYDSVSSKKISNNSVVSFEIINYQINSEQHTAECLWGNYVGTIKYINQIK